MLPSEQSTGTAHSPGCVDTGEWEMDVDKDIEKSASLYFVDGIIK